MKEWGNVLGYHVRMLEWRRDIWPAINAISAGRWAKLAFSYIQGHWPIQIAVYWRALPPTKLWEADENHMSPAAMAHSCTVQVSCRNQWQVKGCVRQVRCQEGKYVRFSLPCYPSLFWRTLKSSYYSIGRHCLRLSKTWAVTWQKIGGGEGDRVTPNSVSSIIQFSLDRKGNC